MGMGTGEFRAVVEQHQSMVYSIALRITGDPGTAEEVAQDAFLTLYRSSKAMEGEEHVRFWLRKAATHGAIDALRRRSRRPECIAEEWVEDEHSNATLEQESGLDGRLQKLLETLPESQRIALVLRYGEDLRPDEIANVLGQPVATVKSHLQRGLALLRRKASVSLKEHVRGH